MPHTNLHNTSQLLLRHADAISGARVLVVGFPQDALGPALAERLAQAQITWFTFDYAAHQHARALSGGTGVKRESFVCDSYYTAPAEPHDTAILFLPKSRALAELMLTMAAGALHAGASVLLVGENSQGIRSARRALEQRIGAVRAAHAGRHSLLYDATLAESNARITSLDSWAETYSVAARGHTLQIVSLPGVFSHGRLDEGTRLLLDHLAVQPNARVLDFGCGAGVIGALVKQIWPNTQVSMVDSNALAVEAARRTAQANQLAIEQISVSNVFSNVTARYTQIITNPPFHSGSATDYSVVTAFLQSAKQHLAPRGRLTLVANQFLKYQPLMEQYVGLCRVIASNKSYRVYECVVS